MYLLLVGKGLRAGLRENAEVRMRVDISGEFGKTVDARREWNFIFDDEVWRVELYYKQVQSSYAVLMVGRKRSWYF